MKAELVAGQLDSLRLVPHNLHDVRVADRRVLFHVPTTALFEADAVTCAMIDFFRGRPAVSAEEVRRQFEGRYDADEVAGALRDLIELEVVQPADAAAAPVRPLQI